MRALAAVLLLGLSVSGGTSFTGTTSFGTAAGRATGTATPAPVLVGSGNLGPRYRLLGARDTQAHREGRILCSGDGADGDRVQAVYVHAVGSPDRLPGLRTSLARDAVWTDGVFEASARQTGGHRHLRYTTTTGRPGCQLSLLDMPVAATAPAQAVYAELALAGLADPTRHYLVWVDDPTGCGQATLYLDQRPDRGNANNTLTSYALVNRPCWGTAEPHELLHTFGGVQLGAPHSTGSGHCTDGPDVMCTYTGGAQITAAALQGTHSHGCSWVRLDCGHDDYYSTAPTGWLATHWNAARSSWLYGGYPAPRVARPAPPGSAAPAPAPSPTTVAGAPPTQEPAAPPPSAAASSGAVGGVPVVVAPTTPPVRIVLGAPDELGSVPRG